MSERSEDGHRAVRATAAGILLLLFATGAHAGRDASSAKLAPHGAVVPEVTVQARREAMEREVHGFVSSVQSSFETSLARWNRPICPLVVGLQAEDDRTVAARVSEVASAAGAHLAPQPCVANFAIIVTAQPDAVLEAWHKRARQIFGGASRLTVNPFIHTPRPARVWYNTNGESASREPYTTSVGGVISKGSTSVGVDMHAQDSRLAFNSVRAFSSIIVTFDSSRVLDISVRQLADYAAMVGLAEIRLDADLPDTTPTILHLFSTSEDARPAGLSSWDVALLKALYHADQSSTLQKFRIMDSIIQDIAP